MGVRIAVHNSSYVNSVELQPKPKPPSSDHVDAGSRMSCDSEETLSLYESSNATEGFNSKLVGGVFGVVGVEAGDDTGEPLDELDTDDALSESKRCL